MSAHSQKAGPIAYALTSFIIYGLVVNCGDRPSLSRISSKCRTESSSGDDAKKADTGGTSTAKKSSKAASLTELPDDSDQYPGDTSGEHLTGYHLVDESEPGEEGSFGLADDTEAFYDANVKSLIDGKCAGCHSPGRTPPTLDTYTNVKKQSADILRTMRATDSSVMPPGGALPDSDIAKVAQWALLLNSSTTGGPTSTSRSTGTSRGTTTTKNPAQSQGTSSSATKDECKPSSSPTGTSTATRTAKGTSTKSATGTGTSTAKK